MISVFSLSSYSFDFSRDIVIFGDCPSVNCNHFKSEYVSMFAINRAFSRLPVSCPIVTLFLHKEFMIDYIKRRPAGNYQLIVITLEDIRRFGLPAGDTMDMFLRFLVNQMRAAEVSRDIYLSGVEFSDPARDWKTQVESIAATKVQADYGGIGIYLCQENKRLEGILPYVIPVSHM